MATVRQWKESMRGKGSPQVEGVSGVEAIVATKVQVLVDQVLEDLTKSPELQNATPDEIAEAILKGLGSYSKEALTTYIAGVKAGK